MNPTSESSTIIEVKGELPFQAARPDQIAALAGAPEGSTIRIELVDRATGDIRASPEFGRKYRKTWTITVDNAEFFDEPTTLQLCLNWSYELVLKIENVSVQPTMRRMGVARDMTRRIAKAAHELGIVLIGLVAAYEMSDGTPIAGLEAWRHCGFTGGVVSAQHVAESKSAEMPTDLSELPPTSAALAWHKERKHLFFLTFDPNPGSANWALLDLGLRENKNL